MTRQKRYYNFDYQGEVLHTLYYIALLILHYIITLYWITFISVDFCLFEGADYRICRVDQSWGTDTQIPSGRYILHSI